MYTLPSSILSASHFCIYLFLVGSFFDSSAPNCFPSYFFHLASLPFVLLCSGHFQTAHEIPLHVVWSSRGRETIFQFGPYAILFSASLAFFLSFSFSFFFFILLLHLSETHCCLAYHLQLASLWFPHPDPLQPWMLSGFFDPVFKCLSSISFLIRSLSPAHLPISFWHCASLCRVAPHFAIFVLHLLMLQARDHSVFAQSLEFSCCHSSACPAAFLRTSRYVATVFGAHSFVDPNSSSWQPPNPPSSSHVLRTYLLLPASSNCTDDFLPSFLSPLVFFTQLP